MRDELRPRRRGDRRRLSVEATDAIVEAAAANRIVRGRQAGGEIRGVVPAFRALVQNDTDDDQDRYAVYGLDDVLNAPAPDLVDGLGDRDFEQWADGPVFSGILPDESYHLGQFAIAQEPIRKGDVGICTVQGITIAKISYHADNALGLYTWHDFADIKHEDASQLHSCLCGGARILFTLWPPEGTEAYAVVKIL